MSFVPVFSEFIPFKLPDDMQPIESGVDFIPSLKEFFAKHDFKIKDIVADDRLIVVILPDNSPAVVPLAAGTVMGLAKFCSVDEMMFIAFSMEFFDSFFIKKDADDGE